MNHQYCKTNLMKRIIKLKFLLVCLCATTLLNSENKPRNLHNGIAHLSEYIITIEYKGKEPLVHLAYADSIFNKSVEYFNGDISEALLAATFATLPFRSIPIKFPLSSTRIDLVISRVPDSLFNARKAGIPSHLFFDSPQNSFGDKDKLAHFFGNAFLSYNISFFNLSKFMGIFVELFEQSFKVDGALNTKDIYINHFGELFGEVLNKSPKAQPSDILKYYSLLFIKL